MGALGIDVGLKGVTDLEPNAEPIRTQFQDGGILLDWVINANAATAHWTIDVPRHHCSDCVTCSVA